MNTLNISARDTLQVPSEGFGLIAWLLNGLVIIFGTLTTLIYFQFGGAPRPGQNSLWYAFKLRMAQIGKGFIAVAFGVLAAGVYAAALTAFVDRVIFAWDAFWQLIGVFFSMT